MRASDLRRPLIAALGFLAIWGSSVPLDGAPAAGGLGTWVELGPMPMTNAEFGAATLGARVYLAGGFNDESALLIYNPKTDTWSRGANLPNGNHHPGVAAYAGKLYVIGGHGTESLVQIYDPATDTWSFGADMPFPRRAVAIVVLNDKIHVIGGTDSPTGGGGVVAHEAYDPVQDSWTTLASLPDRREHAYAAVIDGKIYLASGRNGLFVVQPELFIYDPAVDSWTRGAAVIEPTSGHVVQVVGNRLYAMGGEIVRQERVLDLNQVYDPATDSWSLGATLPLPLHATANTVVDGSIYLFGGAPGVEADSLGIDNVYRFDPPVSKNPPPSKLTARFLPSGKVRLKWKFKHRQSDATSVQVHIKQTGGSLRELVDLEPKVKRLLLSDLQPGSSYTFRVRSRGPSGRSSWSNTVSVTIPD